MEQDVKEEKKEVQRNGTVVVLLGVIIVLVICNIAVTLLFAGGKQKEDKEVAVQTQELATEQTGETISGEELPEATSEAELKKTIKESMESGEGVMSLLRRLYPEYVVVYERNAYKFLTIDESLAKSRIKQENIIVLDDGEIQYEKDGKVISKKGIDVSKYQGEIDWKKVAADGVEFAMIRLGYRGYGTGVLVLDEMFEKNIQEAKAAGVEVGVYFFSQAISVEEAKEEANFVLEHLKSYELDYPIVFDTEEITNDDSRMEGMTPEEISDTAIAFCDTVEAAGFQSMIYANLRWFTMSMDMEKLEQYDKWYAYYDSEFYFPYKIDMWQYSDSGQVDGINGTVDLNIQITYEEQ